MESATRKSVSKKAVWLGRIISGWVVLFLVFDAGVKVLRLAPAIEGTARIGYPVDLVVAIGIVELACLALYVVPRTWIFGAILLTGFLGGATAAKVRLEDPWFVFPVAVGLLVWGGLFLRDDRVRMLVRLES
jgi:hypothetical protein